MGCCWDEHAVVDLAVVDTAAKFAVDHLTMIAGARPFMMWNFQRVDLAGLWRAKRRYAGPSFHNYLKTIASSVRVKLHYSHLSRVRVKDSIM